VDTASYWPFMQNAATPSPRLRKRAATCDAGNVRHNADMRMHLCHHRHQSSFSPSYTYKLREWGLAIESQFLGVATTVKDRDHEYEYYSASEHSNASLIRLI